MMVISCLGGWGERLRVHSTRSDIIEFMTKNSSANLKWFLMITSIKEASRLYAELLPCCVDDMHASGWCVYDVWMTCGWCVDESTSEISPKISLSCHPHITACMSSAHHLHIVCMRFQPQKYFQLNSRATVLLKMMVKACPHQVKANVCRLFFISSDCSLIFFTFAFAHCEQALRVYLNRVDIVLREFCHSRRKLLVTSQPTVFTL